MPKNIRQVGKSSTSRKIYLEDYVMTFTKQLAGEDYSACRVAVLVGQYIELEHGKCLFISGAVEVEGIDLTNNIVFTNDHWTSIYENIKKYFVEAEIVGWFLGGPGYLLEDKERILKAHIDNFAGQDKTLLTFDNMEKEEAFYVYENKALGRQEGYYIYYEKNEEMQNYMIEHKGKPSEEGQYDDRVSREIRTIIQKKKPAADENKSVSYLMYAAGTLLAVIILVVGAAMLSNYDQMKNMQNTLNSLTHNLKEVESVFIKNENNQAVSNTNNEPITDLPLDSEGSLNVEVVTGGVSPLEDINEDEDKNSGAELAGSDTNQPDEKDDKNVDDNQETSTAEEVKYYTVKAGDSLAGISFKLYSSANYISEIKKLNDIEDEDMIYIGQKLVIP
jgi:LysM repeat protein